MPPEPPSTIPVKINKWRGGENISKTGWAPDRGPIEDAIETVEVQVFPNPLYLENQYVKIDIHPPLNPGQTQYVPIINNGVSPAPSQFDAGISFFEIDRESTLRRHLGMDTNGKASVILNMCQDLNAWYMPENDTINICEGLGSDGDIAPHENGHRYLMALLPNLGLDWDVVTGRAFHEYFSDISAITTNGNWVMGEQTARLINSSPSSWADGIRNPLKNPLPWSEDEKKLPPDPYSRSMIFTGAVARMHKVLTDNNGPFGLHEDAGFLFIKALVGNQPYFLLDQTSLTSQDFYWSLIGSLNGLEVSGTLSKIFNATQTNQLMENLYSLITSECVATRFIGLREARRGRVRLKDRPQRPSEGEPIALEDVPHVHAFLGGKKIFKQQIAKLIFTKNGRIVSSEWVTVEGHGYTEYLLDDRTKVTRFDGARRLNPADFRVDLDRSGNPINYISPQVAVGNLLTELKTGGKIIAAIKRFPISAQNLISKQVLEFTNKTNWSRMKIRPVMIDGKNNIQYEVKLGPFVSYIDMRTGEVEFRPNIFID